MNTVTRNTSKEVKYTGRDFDQLKAGLIDFVKNYYPSTYNDFNESSPGMMFLEMAAYIGDVLNYYVDSQLKESMILQATERKNILSIAQAFGYKPKVSVPAYTEVDVFQYLPASGSGVNTTPDLDYALRIAPGMRVQSTYNDTEFIIQEEVNFETDDYLSPRTISVAEISDIDGSVIYYLAKKTYKAISAAVQETQITFGTPTKFAKAIISDENVIGIQDVEDSDGNTWYEVPYLAQDTIFQRIENTQYNDPDSYVSTQEVPYLLKLLRVPRRFISRVTTTGLEMQFGAGLSTSAGEEMLPTPENIALSLPTGIEDTDIAFDSVSPVFTSAYGQAPANTTLTVRYLVGGGIAANVPSNTINVVTERNITNTLPSINPNLTNTIRNSLAVNNAIAASGGRSEETIEEIRQNTLAQFMSQQRAVTKEDYILRTYAMPASFGSVSKAYITPDEQENLTTSDVTDKIANPLALNLYVLGYNSEKQLTTVTRAVKENLKTYLAQYRMLTDSINIRNAFVVNIGVNVSVIAYPGYNANELIGKCVVALKEYFDIERWQINEPIIFSDVFGALMKVKGVQMVTQLDVVNLNNELLGYSNVVYDLKTATKNGVIYPSYDPTIFEVKYPANDIKVRITSY